MLDKQPGLCLPLDVTTGRSVLPLRHSSVKCWRPINVNIVLLKENVIDTELILCFSKSSSYKRKTAEQLNSSNVCGENLKLEFKQNK